MSYKILAQLYLKPTQFKMLFILQGEKKTLVFKVDKYGKFSITV